MIKLLLAIVFTFGLLLCQNSLADGFICYGQGFSYTTKAPKGWKLDNDREKHGGICIVGYPVGGSWENSETVIYINPTI